MMLEYRVYNKVARETVVFYADPAKSDPFDMLEEVLYVWWELEPLNISWKEELGEDTATCFYYHDHEADPYTVGWNGRDFEVVKE